MFFFSLQVSFLTRQLTFWGLPGIKVSAFSSDTAVLAVLWGLWTPLYGPQGKSELVELKRTSLPTLLVYRCGVHFPKHWEGIHIGTQRKPQDWGLETTWIEINLCCPPLTWPSDPGHELMSANLNFPFHWWHQNTCCQIKPNYRKDYCVGGRGYCNRRNGCCNKENL